MTDMDEDIVFIRTMTEDEKHEALIFLSGFSPDGFAAIRGRVLQERERRAQQEGETDA